MLTVKPAVQGLKGQVLEIPGSVECRVGSCVVTKNPQKNL